MANIQTRSKSHHRRVLGASYPTRILALGPYAYWPMNETAGAAALCQVNAAQNGTYTGVTLANALGPDGVRFHPLFDGTNDYLNIQTTALAAAFSGAAGTLALWAKVYNAGVWTDGSWDFIARLAVSGSHEVKLIKANASNQLQFVYTAGGTASTVLKNSVTTTGWMHLALTWDKTADQVKAYYNGAQEGTTQTSLGTWSGSLASSVIGSYSTASSLRFNGWIGHPALWTRALPAASILSLATV